MQAFPVCPEAGMRNICYLVEIHGENNPFNKSPVVSDEAGRSDNVFISARNIQGTFGMAEIVLHVDQQQGISIRYHDY